MKKTMIIVAFITLAAAGCDTGTGAEPKTVQSSLQGTYYMYGPAEGMSDPGKVYVLTETSLTIYDVRTGLKIITSTVYSEGNAIIANGVTVMTIKEHDTSDWQAALDLAKDSENTSSIQIAKDSFKNIEAGAMPYDIITTGATAIMLWKY